MPALPDRQSTRPPLRRAPAGALVGALLAAGLACGHAPDAPVRATGQAGPAVGWPANTVAAVPTATPGAADSACRDLTPERPDGLPRHLAGQRRLMGTAFEIRLISADSIAGCAAIDAALDEVARQEARFSEYRPDSDVSVVNRAAGSAPVEVEAEVFGLLQQAVRLSEATGGAFDVTFGACGGLWSIRERRIPDPAELAACLPLVDYRSIRLDARRSAAFLPRHGMRIGLGGIAKGYGVDRAADTLRARGFRRFVVDGGGDLRVEGQDLDGPWTVHLAHPRREAPPYDTIRLDGGAIVTSGDYFRYFERDGVRYHHILDPATGQPARRSASVTVLAPTATEADALATGLFVLGPERGLAVAATRPGVEALFFSADLAVSATPGFPRGAAADRPATRPNDRTSR